MGSHGGCSADEGPALLLQPVCHHQTLRAALLEVCQPRPGLASAVGSLPGGPLPPFPSGRCWHGLARCQSLLYQPPENPRAELSLCNAHVIHLTNSANAIVPNVLAEFKSLSWEPGPHLKVRCLQVAACLHM